MVGGPVFGGQTSPLARDQSLACAPCWSLGILAELVLALESTLLELGTASIITGLRVIPSLLTCDTEPVVPTSSDRRGCSSIQLLASRPLIGEITILPDSVTGVQQAGPLGDAGEVLSSSVGALVVACCPLHVI